MTSETKHRIERRALGVLGADDAREAEIVLDDVVRYGPSLPPPNEGVNGGRYGDVPAGTRSRGVLLSDGTRLLDVAQQLINISDLLA